MNSYGTDRVRAGERDGQWLISSRLPKVGWTARTPKTATHAEFPGTAVLWEEQYFEVVAIEPLPQGVRYLLEPWADEHAMRVADRYDEESEAARIAAHRAEVARVAKRKSANLFGIFTGHLPAVVQQQFANELGTNPVRLTMLSAGVLLVICGIPSFYCFALSVGGEPLPIPQWLVGLCAWETAQSFIRFNVGFAGSRPIGSLEGYVAYGLFYAIAPKRSDRISPFAREKGTSTKALRFDDVPDDVARNDALLMREWLVTLLPAAEQETIALHTGYDYTRRSTSTAIFIAIVATIGAVSSISSLRATHHFSAFVALVVAGALLIEQFVRIAALRKGPAGSMLAFAARPFTRVLLR